MRRTMRPIAAITLAIALAISHPGAALAQEAPDQSTDTGIQTENEAAAEAAEAAKIPAEGREDLEPDEEGFNDNNIDNDAGVNWEPTDDPEAEVTPGEMRSDSEEIPGGFSKEEADRAETQEAEEQSAAGGIGVQATPTNCRTYWPSPFKVCGEIRKKYDAIGGPTSFLTWPRSDEMGVPDGVGRRNEFVNGFIYWHPTHGAHPITTHFSLAYDRNGWEAGELGYPTSDEFATPNGIGRKQEFANGAIYGSPAGLAAVQGRIYDKYVSQGASDGVMGFPTADEAGTSDGVGRFSAFIAGLMYWHPTHGAHPVSGDILFQWGYTGYEKSPWGYPAGGPVRQEDGWYRQKFAVGNAFGLVANGLADVWDPTGGGIVSESTPTGVSTFADIPNAGGNEYTDEEKFNTSDADGNKVVLRRGYWDGKDRPIDYPSGPFGYDKIYHRHNIWSLYSMMKFIEHSSPVRTEGIRRIYEHNVYRQVCDPLGECEHTGEWFRIRVIYEPEEFGDPGEEKGILTMYPVRGVGNSNIAGDRAPDWFSTDLPTFI